MGRDVLRANAHSNPVAHSEAEKGCMTFQLKHGPDLDPLDTLSLGNSPIYRVHEQGVKAPTTLL
jgi:hypothetical protein